ncbi:alpha/beta hydrolase [Williamsia sp.]|uniref:alpha/beta hydrolase n=1 Tax=Williamsia sp. TaxID=1872085 RepID=UPI001A1E6D06|nr:alpha/beta hydrolase [Williamsia sp.]MBJ7288712.1 alpha/beta hydrolase [Williamsia sp.]
MPVITHTRPSRGSRPMWFGSRLFIRPILKVWPLSPSGMKLLYLVDRAASRGPKPRGVVLEQIELAGRPVELIVPAGPSRRDSDTAVLYLHGGAFITCGLATHRLVAARMSRGTGLPVFSQAYRQLPEAGVGTSVHDAYYAYRELLLERGYRHVVVAGDSAGGFLAAKITEYALRDDLTPPTAYVGFSPLLDLDLAANPDRSSRSDAYLPMSKMAELAPLFDQGPIELNGVRRIAELPANIFPPALFTSAQDEMLEPDIIELVESIDAHGGTAVAHSFAWQIHAFPAISGKHPETLEAIALASQFVTSALQAAKDADLDAEEMHGKTG